MGTINTATKVFNTVGELRKWRSELRLIGNANGEPVLGFVPTMGALHEGHMSLVRRARSECQHVLVSVFVNPLQFGQGEDFDRYPRPFARDLEFCQASGVDVVFHPSIDEMYPQGQSSLTRVIPPLELIDHLCGAFRPGHFEGVATVVTKLFGQVQPHRAYFGEKDYQQLVVVKRVTYDMDLPVEIVAVPTGREADGLAMSSRNAYLSPDQRQLAPLLYQTLCYVRDCVLSQEKSLAQALESGREKLRQCAGVALQYLEACEPDSLKPLTELRLPMVILVAAKFGDVRLIDNIIVER